MKILPVSLSFKSKSSATDFEHQFLYTAKEFKGSKSHSTQHFNFFTGLVALIAVGITLFNIGTAKKPVKNIFVV